MRRIEERRKYMDGWPMVIEFLILGPTVIGPVVVEYNTGAMFHKPVLCGVNLWMCMAFALSPQLLLWFIGWMGWAYRRMWFVAVAALVVWLCGIPIRVLSIPIATGAVLVQTLVVLHRNPAGISEWDTVGIILGLLWSFVSVSQAVLFFRHGYPE